MSRKGQWDGVSTLHIKHRRSEARVSHLVPQGFTKSLCGNQWKAGWGEGSAGFPPCRACLKIAHTLSTGKEKVS